jgi:hypothetical protein
VNRLPATDRAAVKEEAVFERVDLELVDRHGRVLPNTEEVDELEVDHLGAILFSEFQNLCWIHWSSPVMSPVMSLLVLP